MKINKHLRIPLLASLREKTPFPPLVACYAGWVKREPKKASAFLCYVLAVV